jgi:uncharacterized protein with PQ loop repeat
MLFETTLSYQNILLIIANVINLVYNIPQMVRTYKTKSANDFDVWFLGLRIFYNFLWILYGIEVDSMLVCLNSVVTIFATAFVSYYKFIGYINMKNKIAATIEPSPDLEFE